MTNIQQTRRALYGEMVRHRDMPLELPPCQLTIFGGTGLAFWDRCLELQVLVIHGRLKVKGRG